MATEKCEQRQAHLQQRWDHCGTTTWMTRRTWTCATCRIEHTCTQSVVASSNSFITPHGSSRSHLSLIVIPSMDMRTVLWVFFYLSPSASCCSSSFLPFLMTDGDSMTINNLCDSANGTFVTLDDYLPLTGYEPKRHGASPMPRSSTTRSSRIPSTTQPLRQTSTWMTTRSASYSQKYTEITPITAVQKVWVSVRRQCLSWSIERGNLWKRWLLRSVKAPVRRLGLCLMSKEKRLSQNVARKSLITNSLQLKQNKIAEFYREKLLRQQQDFREVHQQDLTKMRELQKFQNSTFDELTRQKFIEDQKTIMELSGRLQELHNEVNCMNDSKDFQDAESVRSGNSHSYQSTRSIP